MANKNKILSAAQKHIQRGNYERAIRELRKLVDEDPRDVRTLLKIGDLFTKKGDTEEATETYRQVAEFYSEQGFFLKAVAVYKTIIKHDPTHIEVANKLAELYEHLGLVQEAMGQFQTIAVLHEQSGSARLALEALARMVDLDPNNISSRVRLAEAYSKQDMLSEAAVEFAEAADALKDQDRVADYIKVAERLVYHDPSRTDVIKDLARIYLQHHDTKRALAKLQLAFQLSPTDIETLTMLASAFHDAGQVAKTLFVYKELVKAYNAENKTNEAMVIYQRILEIHPEDPEAKNALGLVPKPPSVARPKTKPGQNRKTEEPQPQSKKDSSKKQKVETQEEVDKLLTETEVYVKYGLQAKAVDHLNKILEIDPSSIPVYEKLRDLHVKAKEMEPASHALANIIRIHQQNGDGNAAQAARKELGKIKPDHPATDPNYEFDAPFEEEFEVDMSTGAFDVNELHDHLSSTGSMDGIEIDTKDSQDEFFEVSNFDVDFDIGEQAGTGDVTFEEDDDGSNEAGASTISFDATGSPLQASARVVEPSVESGERLIGKTMETPISELPSQVGDKIAAYETDLDAADIFIEQGIFEDARNLLINILEKAPAYSRAVEMQARLNLLTTSRPQTDLGAAISAVMSEADSGDLELPSSIGANVPISENDSFMQLADNMTEADEAELESRFDLALAYQEMGMLDEAIIEFQIASQVASKTLEAYTLIGRCYMEQGDAMSAVGYFFNAIESGASAELATELKYEIGEAYEKADDQELALHWFETVQDENPEFKDVSARIESLNTSA